MISVGLISNLKSGKNLRDILRYGKSRRLQRLRKIVRDGNTGALYVTGKSEHYLEELEQKVMILCEDRPLVVAIDGGDNTQATVTTMIEKHWVGDELPIFAMLGGGSFRLLFKRLGVKNSYDYLEKIVRSNDVNDFSVEGIEMMRIRDDSKREHLCFSTGTGLPVTLLDEVYQRKSWRNVSVAWMIARTLLSAAFNGTYYKRFDVHRKMRINAEGHVGELCKEGEWLGVIAHSISTLGIPRYFPKPRLFEDAETKERFHAVGTKADIKTLLKYILPIYMRDRPHYFNRDRKEVIPVLDLDHQLKEMTIQSEEPFVYQFNGDSTIENLPCMTRELYIHSGRNLNFIKDEFKKVW